MAYNPARLVGWLGVLMLTILAACQAPGLSPAPEAESASEKPVVYVYSARHYGQMEEAFLQFTEETGIEVRFSFGKDAELRERLKAEGEFTPADVLFAVDAGSLWLAAEEGLLQPVDSAVLTKNIPQQWRDSQNRWFAFSLRLRTIVYNPDKVSAEELSTYEALSEPKWKGRLCLRPSTKSYTQSLVASLIYHHGYDKAREIVAGWAANAREFINSDTRILETIAAGQCDVGIVSHYYLARLLNKDPNFPVRIFWANQEGEGWQGRGVHVNVSGAGVTKYARNRENAIRLLEWLSGPGQEAFANGNFEYPVVQTAAIHPILQEWGTFKMDSMPVAEFGRLQAQAIKLMDEAGYE